MKKNKKKKKRQNSHSNKHEISIVFRLMVVSWPAKTSAIEWVFSLTQFKHPKKVHIYENKN